MRYRPMNSDPEDPRLGRLIPDDWDHLEKYPLTAETRPTKSPVVIGISWYAEFDKPELDSKSGDYFIARKGEKSLTNVRGGHCVCLEPGGEPDPDARWKFYDQGHEGACVGFGWSRCMSILNEELYTARWLWEQAKKTDEWPDTNPGDDNGTSVRAAGNVLKAAGHVDWKDEYADDDYKQRDKYPATPGDGIKTFRWAKSVDDVHAVLANDKADKLGAVPLLNSWGEGYPHRTWMPDDVLGRLIKEHGEIAVPTDR